MARDVELSPAMTKPVLFAVGVVVALAGCGDDPPSPSEVRSSLTRDLAHVLNEGEAALAGVDDVPGAAALSLMTDMVRERATLPGGEGLARLLAPADEDEDDLDVDALIETLGNEVFTDANHVGDGVFRIPASLVCGEPVDPTCAENFDAAQLRVRVARDGDGLDFALQVGAAHDEPLVVSVDPNALALTVDLDDTYRAAVALATLFGEDLPNTAMSGQVTGELRVLGPAHARVALTIDRALAIAAAPEGEDLAGAAAFRLSSAAAAVFAFEVDGNAPSLLGMIGLGETAIHIPALGDEGSALAVDLPGVKGTAKIEPGAPLELTGISLGQRTTQVTRDGVPVLSIDLNPDHGRAFGATVSAASITVTPLIDLRIATDTDSSRFELEGAVRSRSDVQGDLIEVLTGRFALTPGFEAVAGQCVRETVTGWTVATCAP